jgi:glutamine---fructose-6-phosphate transaminase (isomerizing)
MLILAQYAAEITTNNKRLMNDIRRLPYVFEKLIQEYETLASTLGKNEKFDHFVFLGSGYNYGLACEAMLKMKEMSLSVSEAFQFLEFRHGPKSLVSPRTLIIGLINDEIRDYEIAVLHEMKTLGASVLVIDESSDGINADYAIELHSGLNTLTRGPLLLPILQLLAYYRSISKGLNPDHPKNLEAVVKL